MNAPRCKHCGRAEDEITGPCQQAITHEIIVITPDEPRPEFTPPAATEAPEDFLERLHWLLSNPQNEATLTGNIPVPELARAIAAIEQVKALQEIAGALHGIEDHLREMRDTKATARTSPGGNLSWVNPRQGEPRANWRGTFHRFLIHPGADGAAAICLECGALKSHFIHQEAR